eukprot:8395972-Pyramimonas_sp.AAC.1
MLYGTELYNAFILVQCNVAAPIFCAPRSTISTCMLVEFVLTKSVLDALDSLVNAVLSTINMFGCEQNTVRLELLVVGRGSEAKASRAPSEIK